MPFEGYTWDIYRQIQNKENNKNIPKKYLKYLSHWFEFAIWSHQLEIYLVWRQNYILMVFFLIGMNESCIHIDWLMNDSTCSWPSFCSWHWLRRNDAHKTFRQISSNNSHFFILLALINVNLHKQFQNASLINKCRRKNFFF